MQNPQPNQPVVKTLNSNRRIAFVSCFNKKANEKEIRDYFSVFGRIMKIKIQKRKNSLVKTNILVQFRKGRCVSEVMKQKEKILEETGYYIDRYYAGEDLYNRVNQLKNLKIEISYLPYEFNDYDLEEIFQGYGKVQFALISKSKPTQKSSRRGKERKNFQLKPKGRINISHKVAQGNSNSGCVIFYEAPEYESLRSIQFLPFPLPLLNSKMYFLENYREYYLRAINKQNQPIQQLSEQDYSYLHIPPFHHVALLFPPQKPSFHKKGQPYTPKNEFKKNPNLLNINNPNLTNQPKLVCSTQNRINSQPKLFSELNKQSTNSMKTDPRNAQIKYQPIQNKHNYQPVGADRRGYPRDLSQLPARDINFYPQYITNQGQYLQSQIPIGSQFVNNQTVPRYSPMKLQVTQQSSSQLDSQFFEHNQGQLHRPSTQIGSQYQSNNAPVNSIKQHDLINRNFNFKQFPVVVTPMPNPPLLTRNNQTTFVAGRNNLQAPLLLPPAPELDPRLDSNLISSPNHLIHQEAVSLNHSERNLRFNLQIKNVNVQ